MRYADRKDFFYDPDIFKRSDTVTALKVNAEYTRKHSSFPYPVFMEVDADQGKVDPLWHTPVGGRVKFKREIQMPCINKHNRTDWRATKIGIVPKRNDSFYLSHLILQELDYFPNRGDIVFYNGYRYMIIRVNPDSNSYWQQTNVWLNIICECTIPPEGDARPALNLAERVPAEVSDATTAQQLGVELPEPQIDPVSFETFPKKVPNQ